MELIVAVDRRWAIGRGEELLYTIPEDLARFREITMGHAIVCGRRTLATFPGGRPLPGRTNYVLTHRPEMLPSGAVGATSLADLKERTIGEGTVFLAGGASVYQALLPYCSVAWVTQVDRDLDGDRFCPDLDEDPDWRLAEASSWKNWDGLDYRFCRYVKMERPFLEGSAISL